MGPHYHTSVYLHKTHTLYIPVHTPLPSTPPPPKRQKVESTSTITEDEVRRYLSRRPITSKDLVKKFLGKKSEMEKKRVVSVLGEIIQRMKDVERQKIKGKLYLSLKAGEQ